SSPANWILGHLPTYCEDVEIVSSLGLPTIDLSTGANIHSLFIDQNSSLDITPSGSLSIFQKVVSNPNFAARVSGILNNQGTFHIRNVNPGEELLVLPNGQLLNSGSALIGDQ
ncbi:MAG: hypothetical protein HKN16_11910, partial [Saprospiraceae bacterium]|nr:hypothetical protein [Saprospiraceae bacterium]